MVFTEYKLSDVCQRLSSGKNIKAALITENGQYPVYGGNGLRGYTSSSNFSGSCSIIGRQGAYCGNVRYFNGEAYMTEHAIVAKANELADDYYLSCVLAGMHLENLSGQSAQPGLAVGTLAKQTIKLPSLDTQRRIANILSSLDRKIELNNQINKQLEEMAQAIFKSWFVDFEPFKDGEFVESELGRIPKGFNLTTVGEIPHTIETGRRPKGGVGDLTTGIPSVGAEHVKGMGNYDFSKTKYISEEYANTLKTGKINGYELLIYKDGGKPGYFIPNYSIFGEGYPFETCYLNEHVFKLDFNGNHGYNAFCYFYFQTDYVMNLLNALGGKAAIPGINRKDVESLIVPSPDNLKVKEFGDFVLPLVKQMLMNSKQNRELSSLRDTLLPKLMSGEINLEQYGNQ